MEPQRFKNEKRILVGSTALHYNGLANGYDIRVVYTPFAYMDKVCLPPLLFEHYHVHDDYHLRELDGGFLLPLEDRAIIDCMICQKENCDEGFLIEALQTYQQHGHKVSDLYECADHYLVPHDVVDYWWKEAEEDTEMSMG